MIRKSSPGPTNPIQSKFFYKSNPVIFYNMSHTRIFVAYSRPQFNYLLGQLFQQTFWKLSKPHSTGYAILPINTNIYIPCQIEMTTSVSTMLVHHFFSSKWFFHSIFWNNPNLVCPITMLQWTLQTLKVRSVFFSFTLKYH